MRMIYENFNSDKVAKELFNVNHLQELQYPGDSKLEEFMEDWYRTEDDQEETLTDRQKERVVYAKIKNSRVLKAYLDKYTMLADDDVDHSYQYLLDSIERYQQKTRKRKNLDDLAGALVKKEPSVDSGKGPKRGAKALAAKFAEQCKFHLSPPRCRWPNTCSLGRHDPEFKGKGSGKGGDKDLSKGKSSGRSDVDKGKPDAPKGKPTGNKDPAKPGAGTSPSQRLPDDALVDTQGRSLCYAYVHGKCTDGDCEGHHGPETPAMRKKRIADEKRKADKVAAAGQGTQSDTEGAKEKPKAKAKAKAKGNEG